MWQDFSSDKKYICGVDEVGRGSWAGPMVVAIAIIPVEFYQELNDSFGNIIKDSKKNNHNKRSQIISSLSLSPIIIKYFESDNNTIDNNGVGNENRKLAYTALSSQNMENSKIYIDFIQKFDFHLFPEIIMSIKAESKYLSVALASIFAKEYRDNLMIKYSEIYQNYDFENNAGYGTKKHQLAIEKNGICPIHRKSFLNNLVYPN